MGGRTTGTQWVETKDATEQPAVPSRAPSRGLTSPAVRAQRLRTPEAGTHSMRLWTGCPVAAQWDGWGVAQPPTLDLEPLTAWGSLRDLSQNMFNAQNKFNHEFYGSTGIKTFFLN